MLKLSLGRLDTWTFASGCPAHSGGFFIRTNSRQTERFNLFPDLRLNLGEGVYFGGEDKVVLRKTSHRVSKSSYFNIAPAEGDVGVMTFAFSERTDFVHKKKRVGKVFEFETAFQVVRVNYLPLGHLRA